ncbi:sodium-dependent transporter [Gracilibacillus boraciitolerans JCM 21714]|uniref:Sodium-dependent transporter n=1 Tax=Gracilibacillus boraciitolerans JCM 21714 TaxID=1298598 RepID=W4VHK2_9BACI|nr:sodium-dependent transporter [Gracilibacillus boraciitolerans]GAE92875.1 sodium-dependent transporter [Gracilibacillus boraciitolerans JCM 21714]
MENRSQWGGSRLGFLMAAIGSAVGLGNIWRFPATAFENGGGAFFVPYLFALLTAGIPLLIMEYTIGHKYRSSSPRSFSKISKGMEWIGWWQVLISFVISTYYPVIIAWAIMYAYFSFGTQWGGDDPTSFFVGDFLNLADPGTFGFIVPAVMIPLIVVWVLVLFFLGRGVKKGIELANKIFIPTLFIVFLIIVIRAVTLPGAFEGLNAFFEPDWSRITEGKVWVAAYGQIFFSLSIAFAIMITYSSYLPKKSDITNNAFITGFANSSFELLAGIGVFAVLGFMAVQSSTPVEEVVKGGVGLAFMVFPEIISQMPASGFFGFLFFASLFLAGLSSMISISETYIAGLQEKFSISRGKAVTFGGGLAFIVSLFFANQGGLNLLDTVDYFINNYGVALAGLFEVVAIAWFARSLKDLQQHADSVSDIKLGIWWRICLGIITPAILGYMMLQNLKTDLSSAYGDYPIDFLFNFGWLVAIGAMLIGAIITVKKWPAKDHEA